MEEDRREQDRRACANLHFTCLRMVVAGKVDCRMPRPGVDVKAQVLVGANACGADGRAVRLPLVSSLELATCNVGVVGANATHSAGDSKHKEAHLLALFLLLWDVLLRVL